MHPNRIPWLYRTVTASVCLVCIGVLTACGGDDHSSSSATPSPTPQVLDTAKVLALAQTPSETASPFAVNGGLVTFSDTLEKSYPIAVNAM